MARPGLASANASTRARVSRSGNAALRKAGKAHRYSPDEARYWGRRSSGHFDSERGRQAALASHAARKAKRSFREELEALEEKYHGRASPDREDDTDG